MPEDNENENWKGSLPLELKKSMSGHEVMASADANVHFTVFTRGKCSLNLSIS